MASPPENENDRHLSLLLDYTTVGQNGTIREYLADERRWVMEAMPNMPEDQWLMYMEWVKSAGQPLKRKSQRKSPKPAKP